MVYFCNNSVVICKQNVNHLAKSDNILLLYGRLVGESAVYFSFCVFKIGKFDYCNSGNILHLWQRIFFKYSHEKSEMTRALI